jgi:hypothetical protein
VSETETFPFLLLLLIAFPAGTFFAIQLMEEAKKIEAADRFGKWDHWWAMLAALSALAAAALAFLVLVAFVVVMILRQFGLLTEGTG